MEATKWTVNVAAEGLSVQVFKNLLIEVIDSIEREVYSGDIVYQDGDNVHWEVAFVAVDF